MSEAQTRPAPKAPRRIGLWAAVAAAAVVAILAVGVRFAVFLPPVQGVVEAGLDGLKAGRFGRLGVEGLSGDLWASPSVARLTLSDDRGVWIEVRNVSMDWRPLALLGRRFDASRIEAAQLRVLRRPRLGPRGPQKPPPVSTFIGALKTRVVLEPAFAVRRGVYDVEGALDFARVGERSGRLSAESRLHTGDRLDARFRIGGRAPLTLRVTAVEALGGALAGALGLPADKAFRISLAADGEPEGGRFAAVAVSGATRPLDATGRWTKAGGSTQGRIDLSASTLTAPWAARLGPEVRFQGTGRPVSGGTYDLAGIFEAEALSARVAGRGDPVRRTIGPEGLRMSIRADSIARIAGLAEDRAGPAAFDGVLTGDARALSLDGRLSATGLAAGEGYRLASIAGPVSITRRGSVVALKADLAGAGGAGAGFAATMLGAAPQLSLDGARQADGQLELRALRVAGRGLEVTAKGGRSLLGGVSLSGEAKVSRLAEARPRASGGAQASWQADQARAGAPWRFSADARGEGLALGLAELDRLLGGSPRLTLAGTWDQGLVTLTEADLDGAALAAQATGTVGADGVLALKADWSAQGPFRAGPVEVTGQARGDGRVTGPVATPRLELTAAIEALDVPRLPLKDGRLTLVFQQQADGGAGTAALAATSAYGPASARSDFAFARGGVDLDGLDVDAGGLTAKGAVSLRRGTASRADLVLDVGPGAFLDAGRAGGTLRIVDAPGGPRAALAITARNARWGGRNFVVRTASLTADGPMSRLPYAISARGASQRGAWTVDGSGVAAELESGYRVAFDGKAGVGRRMLQTTETAIFRFGDEETSARLRLASDDDSRLALDLGLRGEQAEATARAENLSLTLIDPDLDGRVDATLALTGQGARLSGRVDAKLEDARGRGAPAAQGLDGTVRATLAGDDLAIVGRTAGAGGLTGDLDLTLPVEASARPFRVAVARQRPMQGRFDAEGEVGPLWALLMGGDRTLSGFVRTNGTLGGSLASPRASGRLAVEKGRFDDGATGLSLRDLTVAAAFTERDLRVTQASASDGRGGTLAGEGVVGLGRGDASSFRLDLAGFRLIDNDTARASASGRVTASRAADGQVKLVGALTIDRADVAAEPPVPSGVVALDVVEVNRPDELAPPPVARRGPGWALDVTLAAPRRIFLRGRGLDLELSLDARVSGTTNDPRLTGEARVVRGDYDFAGKRFIFDDRGVVYLSTRPEAIRLQLDAVREDPSLTVTVRIRGTAAKPEVTLASSPSLPEDEILSKVLFERSASQLSPVEAAQLASALSSLAGGGGLDVVGNLRAFAGLDRLAFGGGDESGLTVSGGKYLTDDVYLELTGGGRDGPSAQVEWRIGKTLSILSRLAGQAGNRLAVRWRRDY